MVNSNPETVSTDYDTSDKLYFEPLTREDVLHIMESEKPKGLIVQFGGQTPLNLAVPLEKAGAQILGTSPDAIDRAEDRKRFQQLLHKLGLKQPENSTAFTVQEAFEAVDDIGFPVVVRPSYVLGGRAMEIVYDKSRLAEFMQTAVLVSPGHPILIDKFLEDAIELDVDAISDGRVTVIGGIMEHIEQAGIHSGDSACVLPPISVSKQMQEEIRRQTRLLAEELGVIGLMNIQFAIQNGEVFILEVNPRASRTVPFVSKAIGRPLAKLATKVMLGKSLKQLGFEREIEPVHISVKEAVFPFSRFPNVDTLLGPEMKSTGEVMGIGENFGIAFAKAQAAAGYELPKGGTVFISVHDGDKVKTLPVARRFLQLGFKLIATAGTSKFLEQNGIPADRVYKLKEGRPHVVDKIKSGEIQLVVNTSLGKKPTSDSYEIRRTTLVHNIAYATTIAGAQAIAEAVFALQKGDWDVKTLQEYHQGIQQ
jgi:carbamoyl-phosphate synthase large subunit